MAASSTTPAATKLALLRWSITQLPPSSLRFPSPLSSSLASSISIHTTRFQSPPYTVVLRFGCKRVPKLLSVVEEEQASMEADVDGEEEGGAAVGGEDGLSEELRVRMRPCELYVCNLPRSCDISDLLDIFSPYGTVQAVEVSRNSETGASRGCGHVTMGSFLEAKAAMSALDKSDLGGREMCVKFSTDMESGRKNIESLNTTPRKDIVFESPHKVYVGNLSWSVKPEDLRDHFSQFGTVVSTRLLRDKKTGKHRVYGFLSFSSAEELQAATSSSGTEFRGRTLLVREIINRE